MLKFSIEEEKIEKSEYFYIYWKFRFWNQLVNDIEKNVQTSWNYENSSPKLFDEISSRRLHLWIFEYHSYPLQYSEFHSLLLFTHERIENWKIMFSLLSEGTE